MREHRLKDNRSRYTEPLDNAVPFPHLSSMLATVDVRSYYRFCLKSQCTSCSSCTPAGLCSSLCFDAVSLQSHFQTVGRAQLASFHHSRGQLSYDTICLLNQAMNDEKFGLLAFFQSQLFYCNSHPSSTFYRERLVSIIPTVCQDR